jgi:hypothetical protein
MSAFKSDQPKSASQIVTEARKIIPEITVAQAMDIPYLPCIEEVHTATQHR